MSTITPTARDADFTKAKRVLRVVRFVGVRVLLALITLWLLSMIVFAGGQLLPGDVGRAILGPLADTRAVAALNHQLGVDRPLITQYSAWISHFLRGDMGRVVRVSRAGRAVYRQCAVGIGEAGGARVCRRGVARHCGRRVRGAA